MPTARHSVRLSDDSEFSCSDIVDSDCNDDDDDMDNDDASSESSVPSPQYSPLSGTDKSEDSNGSDGDAAGVPQNDDDTIEQMASVLQTDDGSIDQSVEVPVAQQP